MKGHSFGKVPCRKCNRIHTNFLRKNGGSEEVGKKISLAKKGKSLSMNHRKKISEGLIGYKASEEAKKNISLARLKRKEKLGYINSPETREKISRSCSGKPRKALSEEHKKNIGLGQFREKNHAWLGGKSFEPYGLEFDETLRKKIRVRDNFRCQECFRHQSELPRKLAVHHIDFNKKNNNENNLISLCVNCHMQTGFNRENWTEYFQNRIAGEV